MRQLLALMFCCLLFGAALVPSADARKRWYRLGTDTVQIGGDDYPYGWWQSSGPWNRVQFNLHRKCTKLSLVAGPTDDSDTDVSIEFSVLGEGGELAVFQAAFGDVVRRTIPVRRVLRLGFDTATVTGSGWGAWGRVRAYCRRQPIRV